MFEWYNLNQIYFEELQLSFGDDPFQGSNLKVSPFLGTRNSTSFNLKQFAAILTPGLAQPPSSEIHIANAKGVMYLTKSSLIYFIPLL